MTLVMAIRDGDRYVVASDRAVQSGSLRRRLGIPKIWRSSDAIIGGAGQWTQIAAVRNSVPFKGNVDNFAMSVLTKCGAVTRLLREAEPDSKMVSSPSFVIATPGGIFEVQDGEATPVEGDFIAAGVWLFAHGANAMAVQFGLKGIERAKRIAAAVAKITPDVLGPWDWMGTDGSEGTWT